LFDLPRNSSTHSGMQRPQRHPLFLLRVVVLFSDEKEGGDWFLELGDVFL